MTQTSRTWPEGAAPTAEQWLDWLLANDRGDQLAIVQRALENLDPAPSHARWHRALDDPVIEPPGPIRDHIEAAYAKVRAVALQEASQMVRAHVVGLVEGEAVASFLDARAARLDKATP